MKFTIAVYCSPDSTPSAQAAFRFTKATLNEGHEIYRVFFFNNGVLHSLSTNSTSGLPEKWQRLILKNKLDAIICSASAEKRGITVTTTGTPPLTGFTIGGLGQLIEAVTESDRVLTFG